MKALVALSGGVDSAAAAILLQEAGYSCAGVTLLLHPDQDPGDARRVAETLGIPFIALDARALFREKVMQNFIDVYDAGGTPNPCVECNRWCKFGLLHAYAEEHGFDAVATGHYARVTRAESGEWELRRAGNLAKDQSYFLYTLTQAQLARTLFPLHAYEKQDTRALAQSRGLSVAGKKDSQDICFIPDGDYARFLESSSGKSYPPGDFLAEDGSVLGRHRGRIHYTVGQRRGLGVSSSSPLYVAEIRKDTNSILLKHDAGLYAKSVYLDELRFLSGTSPEKPLRASVMLRSRHRPADAEVSRAGEGWVIRFDTAQRAPAAGQSAVLYDGDKVLAGGIIRRAEDWQQDAAR